MKLLVLFYLINFSGFSDENKLILTLISKTSTNNKEFKAVDNFSNLYFIKNNELIKISEKDTFYYRNNFYSNITSLDAKNPLRIQLFYEDFNSLLVLDNKLSEISKVDFNFLEPTKTVSKVSASSDNNIWIFNELNSKLELFNYINQKSKVINYEISGEIISLVSNYKYCWVLTDTYIYKFNYFGSLIDKTKANNIEEIVNFSDVLIFKRDNELFYYDEKTLTENKFDLEDLLIKDFFVINQSLYIYDSEHYIKYQIQKK
tara:strand:- start:1563 stop:2342 length:780 start_codon:yes stop_codon:yes gene_type:complete